jgi:hypothetical protein
MTISAAVADLGGRGRLRLPEIVLQQEQTYVINTVYRRCRWHREQFIPGVVDTGQKQPKSQKLIAGVNDTAQELFTGVNDTADKFFGGVSDTGN